MYRMKRSLFFSPAAQRIVGTAAAMPAFALSPTRLSLLPAPAPVQKLAPAQSSWVKTGNLLNVFSAAPGLLDMTQYGTTEMPYVWGLFTFCIVAGVVAQGNFPVIQYENKVFAGGMGGREQEGPGSTWPASTAILLPLFMGSLTDSAMGTWSYMFWLSALGFIGMWLANPIGIYGFNHNWLGVNQTPMSIVTRWLTGAAWVLRLPLRVGWSQFLIGFRLTVNVLRILNSYLLLSVGLETIITIMELVIFNFYLWGPVDYMFWYFLYLMVAYCKGLLLILHLRLMITLSGVWLHPARYMSDIPLITSENKFTHDDHHH
jgi:hypothetical protein